MSTILTDDEIVFINALHYDLAFRNFEADIAIARAVEAAVLAKLAQQEPVDEFTHWLNARRDSPVAEVFHELVARFSAIAAPQQADRQRVPDEPDWRHPKIQALIGADARNRICIDLVWRILENPSREFTARDMEYWDALHDKVQEVALAAAPEAPAQASAVDERAAFTVVYRNPTPEEVGQFMDHPKSVWLGWCHAAYQRDEARAALAQKGGAA